MKTVNVRVPVLVTQTGEWYAFGDHGYPIDANSTENRDYAGRVGAELDGAAEYLLTATLTVPSASEVAAQVEKGGEA